MKSEDLESILVSYNFLCEDTLPKEKKYLYKFFKSKCLRIFVRYFNQFRSSNNFTNHSGCRMTVKKAAIYARKFQVIEQMYDEARKNGDFELIDLLERGKLPSETRKKIGTWFQGNKR